MIGCERELLNAAERRSQFSVDRSRAPVGEDCVGSVVAKYRGRDRAVSVGSEHTAIQFRGEGSEQLPLTDTPIRRATQDGVS